MPWFVYVLICYWLVNLVVVAAMTGKTMRITPGYVATYVVLVGCYIWATLSLVHGG